MYGYVRLCIVVYGYVRLCIVVYGCQWLSMTVYNCVWLCIVTMRMFNSDIVEWVYMTVCMVVNG